MRDATLLELEAVVLSSDRELVQTIKERLHTANIEATSFSESAEAGEYISKRKIDAVIVDSEVSGGIEFLKKVRTTASNGRTPTFVTIRSRHQYADVASAAHFIIEKSVLAESLDRALRAALPLMLRERRHYYRLSVHAPVKVAHVNTQELFSGESLNISESGMALRCEVRLSPHDIIRVQVALPKFPGIFRCSAEVIWADSRGLAGTRFLWLKGKGQELLSAWIQRELEPGGGE